MSLTATPNTASEVDLPLNDLGPLAWVLEEMRKALNSATRSLRRFAQETKGLPLSEIDSVDASQLRVARQHLHQAAGAAEMVGQAAAADMMRAMELATQRFAQAPQRCTEEAVNRMERAGFGLMQYLESVLNGKSNSPVALFPQYRDVQALAGNDRVHPADLWPVAWQWLDPQMPQVSTPQAYDTQSCAHFEQALLQSIKSQSVEAAVLLRDLSLEFAAAQTARQPRVFWKLCAAFFEASALGLCPPDVYVKRLTSRILQQFSGLVRGELGVPDRLAQELLFFCAQAEPDPGMAPPPNLSAVRATFGLGSWQRVNYENSPFGAFDPAILAQARKRIAACKEAWSSVAGNELGRLRGLVDQFSLVADSLIKLHPQSAPLAVCLRQAAEATQRSGQAPSPAMALEVATAVMFLEAAFEELDPNDQHLAARTARLAQRLQRVQSGGQPEPLEPWIEELYHRVSDRQTMGSVVGELRSALGEMERTLDQHFRKPDDASLLAPVPGQLMQMRGVLSVLGLDQAVKAVLRMRQTVENLILAGPGTVQTPLAQTFNSLGNNLGALGLLFDMLSYQPMLVKKLFLFNEAVGELQPMMGRMAAVSAVPAAPAAVTPPPTTLAAPRPVFGRRPSELAPAPAALPLLPEELGGLDTEEVDADTLAFATTEIGPGLVQDTQFALPSLPDTADLLPEPNMLDLPDFMQEPSTEAAPLAAVAPFAPMAPMVPMAPMAAPVRGPAPAISDADEDEDRELLGIFLDEASEVVATGKAAVAELATAPADLEHLTSLRRAFHTLKGSSRMVGLGLYGDAAWAMEQMLNTWLADRRSATPDLRKLSAQALDAFSLWAQDIASGSADAWTPRPFQLSADALRLEDRFVTLDTSAHAALPPLPSLDLADLPDAAEAPDEALQELTPEDLALLFPEEAAPASAPAPSDLPTPAWPTLAPLADIDLDSLPQPAAPLDAHEELAADLHALQQALVKAPAPAPAPVPEPEPVPVPVPVLEPVPVPVPVPVPPPAPSPVPPPAPAPAPAPAPFAPEPEPEPEPEPAEEVTRAIGDLRISIPLYNVFLNEADEWSRRLQTELSEWAMELHRPLAEDTVGLAHSLAGSSSTVGFKVLSDLARLLEHALQLAQLDEVGTEEQAEAFNAAAEDIRRLLHQFAAGFLKEPNPAVVQALQALLAVSPLSLPGAARMVLGAPGPTPEPTPETTPQAVAMDDLAEEAHGPDDEADFESEDAPDAELFAIFDEEAQDLMPQLGAALRQWVARPDNLSARAETLRVLHTLKGSARLAGAMRLGERAHHLESAIERLSTQEQEEPVDPQQLEGLLVRFDALQSNFDDLRKPDALWTKPPAPAQDEAPSAQAAAAQSPVSTQAPGPAPVAAPKPATSTAAALARPPKQAVRIRSQVLDRLVNHTGEVMMTRARLESGVGQMRSSLSDLTDNLDRLRHQLRDIELQAELQMQSRMAQTKDAERGFDPLEFDRFTRVQELTRMMAESVNDVATVQRSLQRTLDNAEADLIAQSRQTRELQRDLLHARMTEFDSIVERLYRVVRQAAKECGKQVKLDITGGSIEMDRGVLDRMLPAFEHLLRNAVAHGIELPADRLAAGKPAVGAIAIQLNQEGNDVSVAFSDDGAGLDPARIRDKALAMGLITPDQPLAPDELVRLVFMPGFTTVAQVTELAGRGIGMDVVRSEVLALGGRIESDSQRGQGTQFTLVLPLTTAVTQVVMLRAGRLAFGAPANLVELVRRIPSAEVAQAYASGSYVFGEDKLPFYWAGALLQAPGVSEDQGMLTGTVVILRSAQQRVALHVDEVLGNQEVVVKNLGPQLSSLPGLSGMAVLASGAVVLIYNPVALASVYGAQVRAFQDQQISSAGNFGKTVARIDPQFAGIPLILVVDDSITVRRVTQRLLQREGYRVALAVDGVQAMERLREELPAVVLSDIEMPRMDGFELARTIRANADWKHLPIITITSRMAEKHREHAREIGVNHYLGKPYSEEELLGLIRHYAGLIGAAIAI